MGYSFRRLRLAWILVLSLSLLAGCATQRPHGELPTTGVVHWQGQQAMIPGGLMLQIRHIFDRLRQEAGVSSRLRVSATPVANAYASDEEGLVVTLNAGLIDLIGYDRDAMAFVLAHELAHMQRGHLQEAHRQQEAARDDAVEVLGTLVDFFIPLGGVMVEAGHAMMRAGYSRDDEREADRTGLSLMVAAGFDPQGALRFQRKMARVSSRGLALFATHPSNDDRIEELEGLIRATAVRQDREPAGNRKGYDR